MAISASTADRLNNTGPSRPVTRKVTIPVAMVPLLRGFPDLDRQLWILAIARLVVTAGFSVVMPFLAMHLAVERHVPVLHIGLLWTVVGATSASMQWVSGQVADRLGRRPVLIVAMVLRSVNLAALGWALGHGVSFTVIGLLCILNGAMRAFYDPVAFAVVASLCTAEERVAAFSLHRVGSSVGWALGPLTATLFSDVPFSTLFYVCAPLTLVAAAAVATIPETRPAQPKARPVLAERTAALRDRSFVRFLWATAAFYLLQTQMYHIMSIYAAKYLGLDRAQVGTLFIVNGILVVLLQLPAVRAIKKLGTSWALVVGSMGYVMAYTGCGLAVGYLSLLACVALMTLCEIVAVPAQQAKTTALAPEDNVASYAGMAGLVQGLAQTAGPLLGTCLIEFVSPRGAWFLLAAVGLVAAAGYRPRRVPVAH